MFVMTGSSNNTCFNTAVLFFSGFCVGSLLVIYTFGNIKVIPPVDYGSDGTDVGPGNTASFVRRLNQNNTIVTRDRKVRHQMRQNETRILCWVLTQEDRLHDKANSVKNTWGKRCNILLFFGSVANPTFPVVGLNVPEGREYLALKTLRACEYIYKNYYEQADWFLKTDDDTYIIMENLRYFLQSKNSSEPVYYGRVFHKYARQGYNSGGAGYIMGRETLKRWVLYGQHLKSFDSRAAEDRVVGECLEELGVKIGTTKDDEGRHMFNWYNGYSTIIREFPSWVKNYTSLDGGVEAMSDAAISFHYIDPGMMWQLELFLYSLKIHTDETGIGQNAAR